MKNVWCILVLMTVLAIGCDSKPADRVSFLESQVKSAQVVLQSVDEQLPLWKQQVDEFRIVLADPTVDEQTRKTVTEALSKLESLIEQAEKQRESVSAHLAQFLQAIDILKAGGSIDHLGELTLYAQTASEIGKHLPPPYGGYVLIGSSLITLFGGLFAGIFKQKYKDKEALDFKGEVLEEVVESVNKLLESLPPDDQDSAKIVLKNAQSPDTRAEIMKILV